MSTQTYSLNDIKMENYIQEEIISFVKNEFDDTENKKDDIHIDDFIKID